MFNYQFLVSNQTKTDAEEYLKQLKLKVEAGKYLQTELSGGLPSSAMELLHLLVNTKRPQIYAESDICGNGLDWNAQELSLLGDISVSVDVAIYDNGLHVQPAVFDTPGLGTLVFMPGALLRNDKGSVPADWKAVSKEDKFDYKSYLNLYRRRLIPVFRHINKLAQIKKRKALITIPGLGCGQFAGPFRGVLGEYLKNAIADILHEIACDLPNIGLVYFDPYSECVSESLTIQGIQFWVRPFLKMTAGKPQLCKPGEFAEQAAHNFDDLDLYSIVAWDHVSWPGNDFYIGARATDDGVKAAATDLMFKMTGIEGRYDTSVYKYQPPQPYTSWEQVVFQNQLELQCLGNILVYEC